MANDDGYLAPTPDGGLTWGRLVGGTLVKRYKRFLADVILADGEMVTAHTANTGAMLGCSEPGRPVWLSWHGDGGARKYPYSWEMIDMPGGLVGVNTGVPNRLVRTAILAGKVEAFPDAATVKSEVKVGGSRLDLQVNDRDGNIAFVEIKNCSLVENGVALFPDAVTDRGRRHLEELAALTEIGVRAAIFLLVQRGDAGSFRPADHIDPAWGKTFREVVGRGVEAMAYQADLSLDGIRLGRKLPITM